MPALGAPELIIILVIIILIFGVGKLPEVGSALGKGLREFRSATDSEDKKDEEPPATAASSAPATAVEAPRPSAAIEAPKATTDAFRSYTVQEGDTIESIARRHEVSVEALMQANGYGQRDRVLYAGDNVRIPSGTGTA